MLKFEWNLGVEHKIDLILQKLVLMLIVLMFQVLETVLTLLMVLIIVVLELVLMAMFRGLEMELMLPMV